MQLKVFLVPNLMLLFLMCHFAQGGLHIGQIVAVDQQGATSGAAAVVAAEVPKVRTKRGIFWDFFQKIAISKNLIVDQYTDTRDTLNEIYNMINGQFSDPAPAKPMRPTTTTAKPKISREDEEDSSEATTTTEAYTISRYELGRILGRNFRGLQRVAALEFKDAFNATKYNLNEYKAEADKQFANSLAIEKKNKLKSLKG